MSRTKRAAENTVVMQEFDQVMMCHPNPDKVCLAGGCIHCEDSATWWTVDAIRAYAATKDQAHWEEYLFGYQHWWWNLPKKMGDTGVPFCGSGEIIDLE